MYYPGEEKLVSLEVLKLYLGEDMICQDPEDRDPERWLDKGELMELPESPLGEAEMRSREPSGNQRGPEIPLEPYLEIQVIPDDPEEIAVKEGIHERIQTEIHHEDKEVETAVEEMLKVPRSTDASQHPVLNTNWADAAYLRSREKKPRCGEV